MLYCRRCLSRALNGLAKLHKDTHINHPCFNRVLQVLQFFVGFLQAGGKFRILRCLVGHWLPAPFRTKDLRVTAYGNSLHLIRRVSPANLSGAVTSVMPRTPSTRYCELLVFISRIFGRPTPNQFCSAALCVFCSLCG